MAKKRKRGKTDSIKLAHDISELSLSIKAEDVVILDLKELTSMTDYFVICTGGSDKQVQAICDNIVDGMAEQNLKPLHKEGYNYGHWILLDFIDVIVHIFQEKFRSQYNLEQLWGDAPIEHIEDKPIIEKEEK